MGLECRPRDGVQTSTAESVCQKPLVVDPSVPTCATMLCTATTTCVEDSVNGARCIPMQLPMLQEGEVCMSNGDKKGDCIVGLECRPRDGAQTFAAESVCQKPPCSTASGRVTV
eukprot:TRINITY_DN625_c1_g1_i4.p2 TRINITY_DN625_c1_g1~~TRINITY_DN625_c1_g1_i4.p2  ORF type:complete len:130 (+),score=27.51 TRINITY_DN625_c1_g1_i4:50-391(+)